MEEGLRSPHHLHQIRRRHSPLEAVRFRSPRGLQMVR